MDPADQLTANTNDYVFHCPLDEIDGASRVLHPLWSGYRCKPYCGVFLKDYRNPCFLQELTTSDPYSGVVHDHRLKEETLECVQHIYEHRIQVRYTYADYLI